MQASETNTTNNINPKDESKSNTNTMNTSVYDKCKQVIVFHNHLLKFFKSLKETLPDTVVLLSKAVLYYKCHSRYDYIVQLLNNFEKHLECINSYSEIIFSESYSDVLILIPDLDLRVIWSILEQADTNVYDIKSIKKTIFNHLQALYITGQLAMDQINKMNNSFKKQKDILLDMFKNLNIDEKIKSRVDELRKEEEEAEKTGSNLDPTEMIKNLQDLIGEDNLLTKLAQELTDEINLNDIISDDPKEVITKLFADNGKKLQELIMTVADKIDQKIKNKEISKEQLQQESSKLYGKFNKFTNMPGIKEIMKSINPTTKFQEMYNSLPIELQQGEFAGIPDILKKNMNEYTDDEMELLQKLFNHQNPTSS